MASRFGLSGLLKAGLRGSPAARVSRYATAAGSRVLAPGTRTTTLANGLTIATEDQPHAQTATVGVWIDAGSRGETGVNNGVAHFLEHMAFKGTKSRTQHQLELQIENMGAHLNAYTSREQTVYYAKAFRSDVPKTVEILSDILQNSNLDPAAIERERDVILREQQEVDKIMEEVVFDHLHATAFQGHSLGRTILGPRENILSLQRDDLAGYIKSNYAANRMVLVGAGAVEHDALVQLAEKHFSSLPAEGAGAAAARVAPKFVGSDLRIRNDALPQAHMALAVEGVGWSHKDYLPLLVMQTIVGSWDRGLGAATHLSSRLSGEISKDNLANSFTSFHTAYTDTGLWGIYLVSENVHYLDDLVHNVHREWNRLSVSVTDAEVARAKQQLKAALLLGLDGTTAVAEDIGRQMLTSGRRQTPAELEQQIENITTSDIKRCANEYLWDREVAVVGFGPIEAMPDYQRIRSMMSWNRV
ncbi:Metalloenzyme, LuxS/M16 peptidase-like protein [Thamnocephalis sphaerospora]|uniref:mitochondrial processing peptidase n=1 Tax=Thamnocephalis sphaerospora TaxID=78915 RepID=A0A4P9XM88_9FUNG|nr:Metalloenzyme, LuxS/M16 peptidase-like protein [Thamnocephalis sphaerospora]|eukprot:RKP06962.1 Metalloenzyme, LuxS/M16 peptidase-like protein [Thamnocephalis sphaerospora]